MLNQNGCNNGGVFVVIHRSSGRKCIEKGFTSKAVMQGKAEHEITTLRSLRHKNVVEYIDAFYDDYQRHPVASIYMENCDLGTLESCLKQHIAAGKTINENFVWSIWGQLVNALGYIQHGFQELITPLGTTTQQADPRWRGLVHRDIHIGNIFLKTRPGKHPRVLLGDFGEAIIVESTQVMTDNFQYKDPYWAPNEAPGYGFPSDIFMLGSLIQAVVLLDIEGEVRGTDFRDIGRRFNVTGPRYSAQLKEALCMMMQSDWHRRPTIKEIARLIFPLVDEVRHGYGVPDWSFDHH
ncbi:MAG: hypothetical protein Q9187_008610 [Circinaria calcarea]